MDLKLHLVTILLFIGFECIDGNIQVHGYTSSCEGRGTPRKYSDVPCNINKQSYCTEPGDAYPRHAVRRFVDDNQGLMRRMYGDLRHLSVLRSEMEWGNFNDVQQQQQQEIQRTSIVDDPRDQNTTILYATTSFEEDDNVTDSTSTTTTTTNKISTDSDNLKVVQEPDKGINACPTKKEVVAPYWAVNTRGRTLAVVNDPPYEQHIHWEKCLNENQQMLCRDGCKCEQQFRLQRLLAFDPTCDCKGVFMDWFLLPSCCVCKCYGLSYNNTTNTSNNNGTSTSRRRQGRDNNLSVGDYLIENEQQQQIKSNLENDTQPIEQQPEDE